MADMSVFQKLGPSDDDFGEGIKADLVLKTTDLEKRRNGEYTCLDCIKSKSKDCFKCKNWHLFVLDINLSKLSYAEKSAKYANKKLESVEEYDSVAE